MWGPLGPQQDGAGRSETAREFVTQSSTEFKTLLWLFLGYFLFNVSGRRWTAGNWYRRRGSCYVRTCGKQACDVHSAPAATREAEERPDETVLRVFSVVKIRDRPCRVRMTAWRNRISPTLLVGIKKRKHSGKQSGSFFKTLNTRQPRDPLRAIDPGGMRAWLTRNLHTNVHETGGDPHIGGETSGQTRSPRLGGTSTRQ